MFIKELYVVEAHRGGGVGQLLMQRLFELAKDSGCSRIEWMTEFVNADAMRFYGKLGHAPNQDKAFYRVQGAW